MQFPHFTRELQVPQPSPLWGVTPYHIIAIHRWNHADKTYLDFISDPEIVNERKDSRVDPLNKIQRSIIAACNLGDLYIEKRIRAKSRPVFLCRFKQGSSNKPYMEHLLGVFEGYQSSAESVLRHGGSHPDEPTLPKSYYFWTKTDFCWEWFHEQVYTLEVTQRNKVGKGNLPEHWTWTLKNNLKKTIPSNLDVYFADADIDVVLAYLYMDDGKFQHKGNSGNCYFCLNDYPRSDLLRFSDYLNKRFGWKTKVAKRKTKNDTDRSGKKTSVDWIIFIPADNHQDFFTRISPHVIPHFFYKLRAQFRTYTVKHTDGTKEVKFWPQINKNLPPKVHVPKNRQEWKNSRKELRDWVFKKCENVTTPEEKLASLKIWKKLSSKPRSSYWNPVTFEWKGQWHSVDVTRARNLIKEEMKG